MEKVRLRKVEGNCTKLEKELLGYPAIIFFKGTVPNSPLLRSDLEGQKPLPFL